MRTTYILDTSALINDPLVYRSFSNSNIIIPIVVLQELDKLKKFSNEVGRNARACVRLLDELTSTTADFSTKGINLGKKSNLKFDSRHLDLSLPMFKGLGDPTYGDTRILACALSYVKSNKNTNIVLVSNDFNLRIKARTLGLQAQSCIDSKSSFSDLYAGSQTIVNEKAGMELQEKGYIDPANYKLDLAINECVMFADNENNGIAVGRKVADNAIRLLKKSYPWNLSSRNKEQSFAIDLMLDDNIDLVTLVGKSGTGKSLIVLATALELVLNKRVYDKLIVYRPIQSVGNEIGYTPGSIAEKLEPWFQPIMDSFEYLFSNKGSNDWKRELEMYQKKGRIEFGAITYIRGRSIPNAIILLDESQNLSKDEVKTILTRAGEHTKIIITGDLDQIDNRDLDATNNGLSYVIDKFKNSEIAGHITLTQGERSRLATISSNIL